MTSASEPVKPPPPSTLWSLLGGALALGAVPLGAVSFLLLAPSVADAWNEGGPGMFVVAALGLVMSFFAAVAVFLAGRVSPVAAGVIPFLAVLPTAAGMGLSRHDLGGAFEAIAHANPADRATILTASVSEALWATTFGGLLGGSVALAAGLGLLSAAFARQRDVTATARRVLGLGAGVLVLLGVATLVGAVTARAWGDAYRLLANGGVTVPLPMMVEALVAPLKWQRLAAISGGVAALGVVGGAVVLRVAPRAAAAFAGVGLLAVGLMVGAVRPPITREVKDAIGQSHRAPPLMELEAPMMPRQAFLPVGLTWAEGGVASRLEQWNQLRELHRYASDEEAMTAVLGLEPSAAAEDLEALIHGLITAKATRLELLTSFAPAPGATDGLPEPFDSLAFATRGVSLSLGTVQADCEDPCPFATLEGDALKVGEERWPLVPGSVVPNDEHPAPVPLRLAVFAPQKLVLAALAAQTHHRRLQLLIEAVPEPEAPAAPTKPAVTVDLGVTTLGALDGKTAQATVADTRETFLSCWDQLEEPLRLPLVLSAQLAISSQGEVIGAEVLSPDRDDAVELDSCLRSASLAWEFPAPRRPGVSIVSLRLTFAAAGH